MKFSIITPNYSGRTVRRAFVFYFGSWWLPPLICFIWICVLRYTFVKTYAPWDEPHVTFLNDMWYVTIAMTVLSSISLFGNLIWLICNKYHLKTFLSLILTSILVAYAFFGF